MAMLDRGRLTDTIVLRFEGQVVSFNTAPNKASGGASKR